MKYKRRQTGEKEGLVIGIDASRNRSGGAIRHLIGILNDTDPTKQGIREVHVWSYKELLSALPNKSWLMKHNPKELERSIFWQIFWQFFFFPRELAQAGCEIVLNTDAGSVCPFHPSVTMSRDMLSYEPGEIERYGFSKARLRLILLRYIQNRSLRSADGSIFLTKYAAKVIQKSCGKLSQIAYIPHGIGALFKNTQAKQTWPVIENEPIRCLYVSNAAFYKHQWIVVQAIARLRKRIPIITLTLVGGGSGRAQQMLDEQIRKSDPDGVFVRQFDFVPLNELPQFLAEANLFIFASSCENMPNTLVEAMAVGLPIACSNRGPMPEVLEDGGVYFDPENALSIEEAVEKIIRDEKLRTYIAKRAKELSLQFLWSRCAKETWAFLRTVRKGFHKK